MATADVIRPMPRRPFQLQDTPSSTSPSRPCTPPSDTFANDTTQNSATSISSRSRSFLNLTSSTLFGIYSPSVDTGTPCVTRPVSPSGFRTRENGLGIAGEQKVDKKWGVAERGAVVHTGFKRTTWFNRALQVGVLGLLGAVFGIAVTYVHDRSLVAITDMAHVGAYLSYWAALGICLAHLLPWLDRSWNDETVSVKDHRRSSRSKRAGQDWTVPRWIDIVRAAGLFVGLTFAIVSCTRSLCSILISRQRRLPWHSTLQRAASVCIVNPAVWYVIDRTIPGLILSTTLGVAGSALFLSTGPDSLPLPIKNILQDGIGVKDARIMVVGVGLSQSTIEGGMWAASVLFVMCITFGNIGRRL